MAVPMIHATDRPLSHSDIKQTITCFHSADMSATLHWTQYLMDWGYVSW
jgi:hypothetical protein